MRVEWLIGLTIFVAMFMVGNAYGQGLPCNERNAVIQRLAEKYGESRVSIGLDNNGNLLEMYANEETGTWSFTTTLAPRIEGDQTLTCLMASGESFEQVNDPLPLVGEEG